MNKTDSSPLENKIAILLDRVSHLSIPERRAYLQKIKAQAHERLGPLETPTASNRLAEFDAVVEKFDAKLQIEISVDDGVVLGDAEPALTQDNGSEKTRVQKSPARPAIVLALILAAGFAAYLIYKNNVPTNLESLSSPDEKNVPSNVIVEEFNDIRAFKAVEGHSVEEVAPSSTEEPAIRIRSQRDEAYSAAKTEAVFVRTSNEFEEAAVGQIVTVSVVARMAQDNPSDIFRMAYSTASSGNSGWREFLLEEEYKSYKFDYEVSDKPSKGNGDYIGIWADPFGQGGGMDIKSLSVSAPK